MEAMQCVLSRSHRGHDDTVACLGFHQSLFTVRKPDGSISSQPEHHFVSSDLMLAVGQRHTEQVVVGEDLRPHNTETGSADALL